jgi:hypothetical protein
MAYLTLRPSDRREFDSMLGELASQFPSVHVEASHNDSWASYRLDVSCDASWERDLIAWIEGQHASCPRT